LLDFFLGDSRVFFGDLVLGDFGDLAFFGDSRVFGDLGLATLATFAFLGDVASFFGLDGAFLVVEAFLVPVFFDPTFLVDLDFVPVVPAFFDVEVDLFLVVLTVDEEGVDVVPDVGAVVVEAFFVDFFFFSFLRLGASLYEALTFTNNTPSFFLRDILTCFLACSGSTL